MQRDRGRFGQGGGADRQARPGSRSRRAGGDDDVAAERAAELEMVRWGRRRHTDGRPRRHARHVAATRKSGSATTCVPTSAGRPRRRPRRPCPTTRGRARIPAARIARARDGDRCRRCRSATLRRALRSRPVRARAATPPRSARCPCRRPPPSCPRRRRAASDRAQRNRSSWRRGRVRSAIRRACSRTPCTYALCGHHGFDHRVDLVAASTVHRAQLLGEHVERVEVAGLAHGLARR